MKDTRWRKSTYSSNGGASCIEVGQATRTIAVRDTKQNGTGPVLRFSPAAWRRFADQVKRSLAPDQPGLPTPVGLSLPRAQRAWPVSRSSRAGRPWLVRVRPRPVHRPRLGRALRLVIWNAPSPPSAPRTPAPSPKPPDGRSADPSPTRWTRSSTRGYCAGRATATPRSAPRPASPRPPCAATSPHPPPQAAADAADRGPAGRLRPPGRLRRLRLPHLNPAGRDAGAPGRARRTANRPNSARVRP
jgi:Domain of unknown function (DUF397)